MNRVQNIHHLADVKFPVTVLCVDDEQDHLDVLRLFVSPMVERVITAEDGSDGLELFGAEQPDIIMTDITMPRLNGLELCRKVRKLNPRTQLILLTASNCTDYLTEAIDIGVNQFLTKPIGKQKLQASLERCLATIRLERLASLEQERAMLLASALELGHSGIMIMDPCGAIEYQNRRCEEFLQTLASENLTGSPHSSGLHADLHHLAKEIARSGQPHEITVETSGIPELRRWFQIKMHSFNNHQGLPKVLIYMDDATDDKRAEQQLRHLATHDSLTGLFNRAYFEQEIRRLSSGRLAPVSLIIADIDRLKQVNDYYGHETGDQMIIKASEMLREMFRGEDIVARIGGDEFAAILPSAGEHVVRESIRRSTKFRRTVVAGDREIEVNLSFGYATAAEPSLIRDMLKLADTRMYQAKASRRDSAANQRYGS